MGSCEEFIRKVEMTLPEICTVTDLIKVGLFKSSQAARSARIAHCSPPYFKLGHKQILFPKLGIIKWLREAKHDDANISETHFDQEITKTKKVYESSRLETDCR